jgi:hypothetical protein
MSLELEIRALTTPIEQPAGDAKVRFVAPAGYTLDASSWKIVFHSSQELKEHGRALGNRAIEPLSSSRCASARIATIPNTKEYHPLRKRSRQFSQAAALEHLLAQLHLCDTLQ